MFCLGDVFSGAFILIVLFTCFGRLRAFVVFGVCVVFLHCVVRVSFVRSIVLP